MKKLLAIVMVAVMVFSMSAVAFAEEDAARPYTVSYTAQTNEDGSITISVYAKGNVQAYDVGISYKDTGATVKEFATSADFKSAVSPLDVANDVKDESYIVFTGAALSDAAKEYDGIIGSATFTDVTDAAKFQIIADTAKSEQFAVTTPDNPIDIKPYEAPTEAPTPEPADETEAPAGDATPAPGTPGTDATPAPAGPTTAPTNTGSGNAAKTADVAPVAAMVTLVLMAGAVLVVLKKRAAE